jgi:hypothetical protein
LSDGARTPRRIPGERYLTTVTGKQAVVRIVSRHSRGGWWAENENTGRMVRIRTTTNLEPFEGPTPTAEGGATPEPGPRDEQLGLPEDMERLGDIGDLIAAGHAKIEDFDLGKFEAAVVRGYVENCSVESAQRRVTDA